jgi:hypothetical protein
VTNIISFHRALDVFQSGGSGSIAFDLSLVVFDDADEPESNPTTTK